MNISIFNADIINPTSDMTSELLKDFYFIETDHGTFLAVLSELDDLWECHVVHNSTQNIELFNDKIDMIDQCAWYQIGGNFDCNCIEDVWNALCESEQIFLEDNE